MKRFILLLIAATPAPSAQAADAAPAKPAYLVEANVMSIPAGAFQPDLPAITAEALIRESNGTWRISGTAHSADDLLKKLKLNRKDVETLSAPSLLTPARQEAKIEISQALDYLEPVTNDLFRLKRLAGDRSPGIHLSVKVMPAEGRQIRTEVEFTSCLVVRMTELPGTQLRVGPPVMDSRTIRTAVTSSPGEWIVLGGAPRVVREADQREETLLVFLRVTEKAGPTGAAGVHTR